MPQETVSQRLKILIKALGLNPRSFSEKYGVNEGTTRGYTTRGSVPNADYIAILIRSIANLNAQWLLLGEGEMFTGQAAEPSTIYQKNKGGTNIANTHGATFHYTSQEECEKDVAAMKTEIELLRSQLADKELIIQLLQKQK